MYSSETHRPIFKTVDAGTTGRILVIDDDRSFGGFVLAALESRGHDVDWAGCIADGLASLYSHRYDLVIVDLRLPDGSGLQFLRDAMDEGVLVDSAAIVLTGQDDFEEPDDIRVYHKPLDLEPFLDRMGNIVAHTHKRRGLTGRSPLTRGREPGRNGHRSPKREKIDLVLYTSRASEKCQKAVRTIQAVLDQYDNAEVRFSICDLSDGSPLADEDAVVFTPTLVKRAPGPKTWIVGNLNQPDLLIDLLEVSGVSRRRD